MRFMQKRPRSKLHPSTSFSEKEENSTERFCFVFFFKPYEVISGAAGLSRPPRCRQEGAASFSRRTAQEQAGLQPGARLLPS